MQIGRSHHTLLSPQSMITADELIMWSSEKLGSVDISSIEFTR